ncbi:MAG: hypothetical protein KDB00_12070 [Planctomycetales bacterium]|nr:hypothetical protein [Planctomycetales bacterium]
MMDTLDQMSDDETFRALTGMFLEGEKFIDYGVVFFIDPDDDQVIHAALPLTSSTDQDVRRNTDEAIRILPEFLSSLPNVIPLVTGRDLVVRMVSSYRHLDDEVSELVVVPWNTMHPDIDNGFDK